MAKLMFGTIICEKEGERMRSEEMPQKKNKKKKKNVFLS
jgi:hypothetical protein